MLLERTDYKKGKQNEDQTKQVNLLEMTRIPEEWHEVTRRRITETARANSLIDMVLLLLFRGRAKGIRHSVKRPLP